MNNSELCHRWANRNLGKKNCLKGQNMYAEGNSIYSYSTEYGTIVDDKLVLIVHSPASTTSSKHCWEIKSAIPVHMKVIEVDCKGWGYYYTTCSSNAQSICNTLINNFNSYVSRLKNSCGLEYYVFEEMHRIQQDIVWLYENRYFTKKATHTYSGNLGKQVRFLLENSDDKSIVDYFVGHGAYDKWFSRSSRARKTSHHNKIAAWFNHNHKTNLTYKEIKSLSRENLRKLAGATHPKPVYTWDKKNTRNRTIMKYVTGNTDGLNSPEYVTNYFTKERYRITRKFDQYYYFRSIIADFTIDKNELCDAFVKAADKKEYMRHIYRACKIVDKRLNDVDFWVSIKDDDTQLQSLSDEDMARYNFVQSKWIRFCEDEEARRKAIAEERRREDEERIRREIEKNKITEQYLSEGENGFRKLFWEGYSQTVPENVCYGGNVLLRLMPNERIMTSKRILLSFEQCHKYWVNVQDWHNGKKYQEITIHTLSGSYVTRNYFNDIFVCGCHLIAYCEMERIMSEIEKVEQQNQGQ